MEQLEKIEPVETKVKPTQTTSEKLVQFIDKAKQNYKSPTPLPWRKIGDSILGLGTVVTAVGGVIKNPWIVVASVALTWIGKTLTNFASNN